MEASDSSTLPKVRYKSGRCSPSAPWLLFSFPTASAVTYETLILIHQNPLNYALLVGRLGYQASAHTTLVRATPFTAEQITGEYASILSSFNSPSKQVTATSDHNIRLLACPSAYAHESVVHARWLFKTVRKDADIVYAACATRLNNPVTAEERASLAAGHDKCGSPKKDDTLTITPELVFQWLTERSTENKCRVYRLDCPHCKQSWLVNTLTYPRHKCNKLYNEVMVVPYKLALEAKVKAEAEADK